MDMTLKELNESMNDKYEWKTVRVYTARAHSDLKDATEMTYEGLPLVECITETPVSLSKGLSLAKEYEDKGYVVELRRTS
jgi:SepF-like predicted cell division protein (DUF552 family)